MDKNNLTSDLTQFILKQAMQCCESQVITMNIDSLFNIKLSFYPSQLSAVGIIFCLPEGNSSKLILREELTYQAILEFLEAQFDAISLMHLSNYNKPSERSIKPLSKVMSFIDFSHRE